MKKALKELISSDSGTISSKRVVAILCVLLLCLVFVLEAFKFIQPLEDAALIDALVYISMVCLFGTSVEKISFGRNKGVE
jgi:hypothetical protein